MPGTKDNSKKQFRIGRGALRGRVITFHPAPDLRPTLARVREAVFSILAENATNHGFIDGCAGSGIMAMEAASMGFDPIVCLETHALSLGQIKANFAKLDHQALCVNRSIQKLATLGLQAKPWILYMDPPYRHSELHRQILTDLAIAPFFQPGSIYIAESENDAPEIIPAGWETWTRRKYGRAHLWFGIKTQVT